MTASWSKGRNDYSAYYHCRPGCRASNIAKMRLGLTLPVFNYLAPAEDSEVRMVVQIFPRWNRLEDWLSEAHAYSRAA